MWAICTNEFKGLFKGFKSLFIIIFLVGISLLFASLGKRSPISAELTSEEAYTSGLTIIIVFFGMLFTFVLSHDVLSREVQHRTIRFLVTKTTRKKIVAGKTLGVVSFWLVCLILSLIAISIFAKAFFFTTLIQCIVFLTYGISLAMLVSSLAAKTNQSLIIGIVISFILPIISMALLLTDNILLSWLKYLTPYYYMDLPIVSLLGVILLSAVFFTCSIFVFERRDL